MGVACSEPPQNTHWSLSVRAASSDAPGGTRCPCGAPIIANSKLPNALLGKNLASSSLHPFTSSPSPRLAQLPALNWGDLAPPCSFSQGLVGGYDDIM